MGTRAKRADYGLDKFKERQIFQLANIGLSLLVDALHGDDDDCVIEVAVTRANEYGLV